MKQCLKENAATIGWCLALVCISLIGFWFSRGTSFHRLTFGTSIAAIAFLLLFTAFEAIWRFLTSPFS
jgi:hypothetical protein